ncbi:CD225/dispanin family protein [Nocardia macrotermitis]|uniref:CD225/dispanin family protein n=1 Tax=Nocardia macrotermitis TaxID=2585198 RepID=UPI001297271D
MTYGQPNGPVEPGNQGSGTPYPNLAQYQPISPEGAPPRYFGWALAITIIGVVPFCSPISVVAGVVALVYSGQVRQKWISGDIQGALSASRKTKIWAIVATVVEALLVVSVIIYILVSSIQGTSS